MGNIGTEVRFRFLKYPYDGFVFIVSVEFSFIKITNVNWALPVLKTRAAIYWDILITGF